jgi:hypothetical protein
MHAYSYGDLAAGEAAQLKKHCASCAACRKELAGLQRLRQALDTLPAPSVRVDLPRLYADAARIQQHQARRWRRAAIALLGAAAVLLLAIGLKLELRVEAHQLVVRWGTAPEVHAIAPQPPAADARSTATSISPEEFQLMKDLIHALAADGDTRDRHWQQEVSALQARLAFLQERSQERDRVVAALYSAHLVPRDKGAKP